LFFAERRFFTADCSVYYPLLLFVLPSSCSASDFLHSANKKNKCKKKHQI